MYNIMFNSQNGEDEYLETNIFKGYKNGFYLDVCACDGIINNNTLYFEKYNNWSGINVEPIQELFEELIINRPDSINLNCAICNTDGVAEFLYNGSWQKLENILYEKNISKINFLSLDIQFASSQIIRSIDFDEVFIDVILFNNRYNDVNTSIIEYLQDKNYEVIINNQVNILMINKNSIFYS